MYNNRGEMCTPLVDFDQSLEDFSIQNYFHTLITESNIFLLQWFYWSSGLPYTWFELINFNVEPYNVYLYYEVYFNVRKVDSEMVFIT